MCKIFVGMGAMPLGLGKISLFVGKIPLGLGQKSLRLGRISLWLGQDSIARLWVVHFDDFLAKIGNVFRMSHRWTEKSMKLNKIVQNVNRRYLY